MKNSLKIVIPSLLLMSQLSWADTVQLGKVEFIADTNVKMFKFKGEAKDLQSRLDRKGASLSDLEIRIPVNSLKTGMEIRDKHMRERIFTADDGSTPDVVFKASQCDCQQGGSGSEQNCGVDGKLSIRGQERPYKLNFVLKDGSKVEGKAIVDVLEFGVKPEALKYSEIHVEPKVNLSIEAKLQ